MSEARQSFIDEFLASDRLGALVGARFVSLTAEECRYEYDATEGHFNPGKTLHGGALFTAMDSSQGMLVYSMLHGSGQRAATGTATIKYLAPVREERIAIRTRLTGREGRKLFLLSEAFNAAGKTVAVLDEIWIILAA